MSAFVMDERFFNQLAAELFAHATLRESKLNWSVQHVLELRDVTENRYEETIRKFAQMCYALNVAAVNYRYEENDPVTLIQFSRANGLPKWLDEHLLKHLECLSYQCAEGECEKSDTYQKLERLIGHVARAIVGASEKYELANWDYAA